MGKFAGQITIVSQKEHTGSVAVQTTYGVDTLGASVLHKVHDGFALLRIVAGGYIIFGLIEQNIDFLLNANGLFVELHLVGTEYLCTQLGNDYAINRDNACLYKLIGLTATANSGIGQELVKSQRLCRIDMLFLIL